jgi:hypothetical protein
LGIIVLVKVFFDVPDRQQELVARQGLILELLRLEAQLGITPVDVQKPS